jgi:hypothetical protein
MTAELAVLSSRRLRLCRVGLTLTTILSSAMSHHGWQDLAEPRMLPGRALPSTRRLRHVMPAWPPSVPYMGPEEPTPPPEAVYGLIVMTNRRKVTKRGTKHWCYGQEQPGAQLALLEA